MFSLHDITTLARAEGLIVKHYGHGGVREFVCGILNEPMFDDYRVTSNGTFNIYHHLCDDVQNYDPDEHRAATTSTSTVQAPTTPVDDDKIAVDQRGRLCVRANLLRKLGVKPGDKVAVNVHTSVILTCDDAYGMCLDYLVVDKDNCLRLSNSVLEDMFGHPSPDRYKLTFATDSISSFIRIS